MAEHLLFLKLCGKKWWHFKNNPQMWATFLLKYCLNKLKTRQNSNKYCPIWSHWLLVNKLIRFALTSAKIGQTFSLIVYPHVLLFISCLSINNRFHFILKNPLPPLWLLLGSPMLMDPRPIQQHYSV